jgi:hypothetical protein
MKRVAIHSVPRSGSTWLGSIFDSHPEVTYKYQPLFSYRFKSALSESSSRNDILSFFSNISQTADAFLDQAEAKAKGIVPEFRKVETSCVVYKEVRYHHILSNLLQEDEGVFVIGLIRNPLAVLSSWRYAPREFREDLNWDFLEEWRDAPSKNQGRIEEFYGYSGWKKVAELFHQLRDQYPERFYLVRYSDLLSGTLEEVEKLFDFVGLSMKDQTISFINSSRKRESEDAYAVYKKRAEDTDWVGKLPESVIQEVQQDLKGTPLEMYIQS